MQQGKLRALAVTSKERVRQLPDVPAAAETLPDSRTWYVSASSLQPGRETGHRQDLPDTVKVLQSPGFAPLEQLGMVAVGNAPADFAKAIRRIRALGEVIKERKLQSSEREPI